LCAVSAKLCFYWWSILWIIARSWKDVNSSSFLIHVGSTLVNERIALSRVIQRIPLFSKWYGVIALLVLFIYYMLLKTLYLHYRMTAKTEIKNFVWYFLTFLWCRIVSVFCDNQMIIYFVDLCRIKQNIKSYDCLTQSVKNLVRRITLLL
jgi:hypothetical protein